MESNTDSRQRTIVVSVDVEPDITMFVRGTSGLSEGLPRLMDTFRRLEIPADYYFSLDAAKLIPDTVRELAATGQWIGSHGCNHDTPYYSRMPESWQVNAVREATDGLHAIAGRRPKLFRAPNFSISPAAVRELDRQEYGADSSVLPGRRKKRLRLLTVIDHRGAPREPYHPSADNPLAPGALRLWEVPVTENPLAPGGPIGLGYIHALGGKQTLQAIEASKGRIVTILCHTWEAVDLGKLYPNAPSWVLRLGNSRLDEFERVLADLATRHEFTWLQDAIGNARAGNSER